MVLRGLFIFFSVIYFFLCFNLYKVVIVSYAIMYSVFSVLFSLPLLIFLLLVILRADFLSETVTIF